MNIKVLLSIALSLALICSGTSVWAKVTGPCSNCHTMHNSQNGGDFTTPSGDANSTAKRSLTRGDCIGCHTGTNNGSNPVPYVTGTGTSYTDPTTTGNTLAGGSFYWVNESGDSKGHNVLNLSGQDTPLGKTPPGWNQAVSTGNDAIGTIGDAGDTWTTQQLSCAGTYGCHGPHNNPDDFQDIAGAHHGDDSIIDGSSTAGSFRFLTGIIGYEAEDWEYAPSASNHNVYHGKARTQIEVTGSESDKTTISYFCATCHGNYHSGSVVSDAGTGTDIGTNSWLRHPSDYDMASIPDDTNTDGDYLYEYKYYNDAVAPGSAPYSVEAPVAITIDAGSVNSETFTVNETVDVSKTSGNAIVTCISCHRAHGSPYNDLLRWAYNPDGDADSTDGGGMEAGMTAGGDNNTGCFVCHTTKDDA